MDNRKCSPLLCLIALLVAMISCTTPPSSAPVSNSESDRAKAIVQGTSTPDFPATNNATAPSTVSTGTTVSDNVPKSALNAEEQLFVSNYLSKLSYMVYYSENSGIDPRLAKMAVTQANRYLLEKQGLSVIDFDQIERNKRDQLDAYQAETGGTIDMIQYLAQKLNADMYVEIDLKASASGNPGSYSATAQGTMKLFEASTATLLGSIAFMSPPTFSPNSPDAAISNAIAASVWQAMPKVTEQSKALTAAAMSRGVRYDLVLQKTPDAKQISQFVKALSKKIREVEQLNFSPEETKFTLFAFMPKAKIQEAVYEAAQASLLSDIYLVYMRGKSFTFNTGL